MVTDNKETDQLASADPNATAEGEGSSQEVDWEARTKTAEAATLKAQNELKSEQGRRDLRLEEMAGDIGGIHARFDAVAKRMASGETESLPADFAALDQKDATSKAAAGWDSGYQEALDSLSAVLLDDDGKLVVSESVRDDLSVVWKEASQKQDIPALYRVVGQANREAKMAIQQQAKNAVTETEEAAASAKKASDAKNGVHNLSVGTPSGNSGGKSIAQIADAKNVSDLSDEDYKKWVAEG